MTRSKGFTLVELLFVVAIIGIVLSLLAPALLIVKRRARAIQCASNLHQIAVACETYSTANDSIIPYINVGPEAQGHPKRLYHPSTGVPSLRAFLERVGTSPQLARCPSDKGCPGQSFHPTPPGSTCFDDWGQSMLYNASCYVEVDGPGYASGKGKLYGATPLLRMSIPKDSDFLLASDFWPQWHFGASGGSSTSHYYTNLLFFDGHVDGQHYSSQRAGLQYLDWDGLRRWWITDPPPPPPVY